MLVYQAVVLDRGRMSQMHRPAFVLPRRGSLRWALRSKRRLAWLVLIIKARNMRVALEEGKALAEPEFFG